MGAGLVRLRRGDQTFGACSSRDRRAVGRRRSRRRFEGAFKQVPDDVNQFLKAGNDAFATEFGGQPNTKLDTTLRVKTNLVDQRPSSYQDCVAWARLEFQQCFHDSIAQLLHNFPRTRSRLLERRSGPAPSGRPTPLQFDSNDATHLEYIRSAADLRAFNYGLKGSDAPEHSTDYIKKALSNVMVPEFKPKEGIKISANEAEEKKRQEEEASSTMIGVDAETSRILRKLSLDDVAGGDETRAVRI